MNLKPRKLDRRLLLVDIVALTGAMLAALCIRYRLHMEAWQIQLYSIVYVLLLLLTLLIHLYRMPRKRNPSIDLLDPFDILVETFHNQIILLAGLAIFLIATQSAQSVSRRALLYFFLINSVLDYVLRLFYWSWARKHRKRLRPGKSYLVVTREETKDRVLAMLHESLPPDEQIYNCLLVSGNNSYLNWKLPQDAPAGLEAFVYLPNEPAGQVKEIVSLLNQAGLCVAAAITDTSVSGPACVDIMDGRLYHCGSYGAIYYDAMQQHVQVLDVNYIATSLDRATAYIREHIQTLSGQYLCFSNVHTTVMARDEAGYAAVLNQAAFVFPDGMPVARYMRRFNENANRVPGPDFMEKMFRMTMDGSLSHFFYGSTQQTLDLLREKLQDKYPGIRIAGMYSPPFRALSEEEDERIVRMINDSGADIVWIGLGAPKQERWMADHKDRIRGLMCGVGAGFNFHAGNIRRAPYWMQKMGLEWLYRLFQDPKRLFSRYLVTNTKFLWYIITQKKS